MTNWLFLILYTVFPIGALLVSRFRKKQITPDYMIPFLLASFVKKEPMNNIQSIVAIPIAVLNIFVFIVMCKSYHQQYLKEKSKIKNQ